LYFEKLPGEASVVNFSKYNWSRYLNKIESVGLRKAYCFRQIGDLTVSAAKYFHFLALQHGGQNSWYRQKVEMTSLSTYL